MPSVVNRPTASLTAVEKTALSAVVADAFDVTVPVVVEKAVLEGEGRSSRLVIDIVPAAKVWRQASAGRCCTVGTCGTDNDKQERKERPALHDMPPRGVSAGRTAIEQLGNANAGGNWSACQRKPSALRPACDAQAPQVVILTGNPRDAGGSSHPKAA